MRMIGYELFQTQRFNKKIEMFGTKLIPKYPALQNTVESLRFKKVF